MRTNTYRTEYEAIEAWNTRADLTPKPEPSQERGDALLSVYHIRRESLGEFIDRELDIIEAALTTPPTNSAGVTEEEIKQIISKGYDASANDSSFEVSKSIFDALSAAGILRSKEG
jgi:hypothetical protein